MRSRAGRRILLAACLLALPAAAPRRPPAGPVAATVATQRETAKRLRAEADRQQTLRDRAARDAKRQTEMARALRASSDTTRAQLEALVAGQRAADAKLDVLAARRADLRAGQDRAAAGLRWSLVRSLQSGRPGPLSLRDPAIAVLASELLRGMAATEADRLRALGEQDRIAERSAADADVQRAALEQQSQKQADALRDALARMGAASRRAAASTAQARQAAQAATTADASADSIEAAIRRSIAAAAQQAARAAAEAAARRAARPGSGPGPAGRGGGPVPGSAPGSVLVRYGQQTDSGPADGTTLAATPGSAVRAPCSGRVMFAGPFRSYGDMLILDCGRDDHLVLAGLGTIGVSVGRPVRAGAPVGTAGNGPLFVQLRHDDATVDPGRFLQR